MAGYEPGQLPMVFSWLGQPRGYSRAEGVFGGSGPLVTSSSLFLGVEALSRRRRPNEGQRWELGLGNARRWRLISRSGAECTSQLVRRALQ